MALKLHRLAAPCTLLALLVLPLGKMRGASREGGMHGKVAALPVPVREADASCARCHAEITRRYLASPKANASGVAAERLHTGDLTEKTSGVTYTVRKTTDGVAELRYTRGSGEPLAGSHALRYFLGSGHLGTTYLYSEGGYLFETPVAFYARLNAFAMAPGLAGSKTMPDALPMTPGCMRCHMSDVQATDAGTRNRFGGETAQASAPDGTLPFLHSGITCERCHGDASAHVASGGRAAILNPAKLSPAARDSVCSSCHLEGDVSVEREGRSVAAWQPGEDLAQDVTYFVLHGGGETGDRGVSETEQLLVSRCKRESGARMSCLSCHDPHDSPPPAERVTFYRGKCLACHSEPAFAASHFPATPDCTGCHMPQGGAADTPHVAWTDHRLRQRPTAALPELPGTPAAAPVISSVMGGAVSVRDEALGYYKLLLKGQRALAPKAWALMNQAAAADASDVPVLVALGYMNQMGGRAAQAQALYRSALRLEPANPEAANDLGTLLAQAGHMEEAEPLWRASFALGEDVPSLGINLSIAQCSLGNGAGAQATLREVLRFSPDASLARQRLAALESGEQRCAALPSPSPAGAIAAPGK